MELTVKSLQGSFLVSGVSSSSTVGELKQLLHQQHSSKAPEPEEQRLVFRHEVLASSDVVLQQLGITHGDQLVLLVARPPVKRPRPQTTPAADTAAIRTAITGEARRQGIEHTLREERPPVARRGVGLPADLMAGAPDELLQFLQQALGGQLPPGLRLSGSGGGGGSGEEEEAQEEEEGELQVPEPPADRIAQLTDMGFSETLARNALLLRRGHVEQALDWLLQHGDDPAAAEPPTQEQLRQVYGGRRGRGRVRSHAGGGAPGTIAGVSTEHLVAELTSMGFDAAAAQAVLARVGPQLELAVQLLLGGSGGGAAPAQQQPAAAAAGEAATSAGSAAAGAAGASSGAQPGVSGNNASSRGVQAGAGWNAAVAAAVEAAFGEAAGAGQRGDDVAGEWDAAAAAAAAAGDGGRQSVEPLMLSARSASEAGVGDAEGSGEQHEEEEEEEGEDDDEYDDEDEDEYYDGDDDALYDLPIGAMQLSNLGSADMEQLLQGANLQELALGNQLLMPGAMEAAGMAAGGQPSLLRLLDSPAFLQQLAAGMEGAEGLLNQHLQQQQQQQQQPGTSSRSEGGSEQESQQQQQQSDDANGRPT